MVFFDLRAKIKTKNKKKTFFKLRIAILALFVLTPYSASARTFNPHNIITDQDLRDKDALSKTAIQTFLIRENSVLSRYSQIVDNQTLTAAEMIWQVSQKHSVNPKFILADLEKEQGLIHKTQATEKALDWATGYGCYGGTCKEKYRGFYNQIEATAETQEIYWQKAGQFSFKVGQTTKTFDDFLVTPENKATSNLYIYTPYVGYAPELGVTKNNGGNKLFWTVWSRYFTNQKFLDGQVITDGQNFWLIQNNKKRQFASKEILLSEFDLSDVITASQKDLAAYPDGTPIIVKNKSLVKASGSSQIFYIDEFKKRPLIDSEALALFADLKIALAEEELPTIPSDQLIDYPLDTEVSKNLIHPQGKLFKDQAGQIWLIKDSLKHLVDSLVWQNRFAGQTPQPITQSELDTYLAGNPIKLKDGTFVITNDNRYYLISSGERMRIMDLGIFDRVYGLDKKNNVLRVSAALLEVHTAGDMIDYIDDTLQDQTVNNDTTSSGQGYSAVFSSIEPEELILLTGETKQITLKFKNNGNVSWQKGDVWLKASDQDKDSSSLTDNKNVDLQETSVAPQQAATFIVSLKAPAKENNLINQVFSLYYKNGSEQTKIASTGRFIFVKPATTSQLVKQNIPTVIKNKKNLVSVTVKIKNTGKDTWTSKKTALLIYNSDGSASPFYDKVDWIKKDVAAVPINASKIKPGQTAEFRFILNAKKVKAGNYTLNLQLKLVDKDKPVLIDGQPQWLQKITVK